MEEAWILEQMPCNCHATVLQLSRLHPTVTVILAHCKPMLGLAPRLFVTITNLTCPVYTVIKTH